MKKLLLLSTLLLTSCITLSEPTWYDRQENIEAFFQEKSTIMDREASNEIIKCFAEHMIIILEDYNEKGCSCSMPPSNSTNEHFAEVARDCLARCERDPTHKMLKRYLDYCIDDFIN